MKKVTSILYFTGIVFLLSACSSAYQVYKLKPTEGQTEVWENGVSVVSTDVNNQMKVSMAYDQVYGRNLGFDVAMTNLSTDTLIIDPAKFHYLGLLANNDTLPVPIKALNPHQQLSSIDEKIAKEDKRHANEAGCQGCLGLLGVVGDVAGSFKQKGESEADWKARQRQMEDDRRYREQRSEDETIRHERTIGDLSRGKDYWQTVALQKNTLLANDFKRGKIFLPYNQVIKALHIFYDGHLVAIFDQEVVTRQR